MIWGYPHFRKPAYSCIFKLIKELRCSGFSKSLTIHRWTARLFVKPPAGCKMFVSATFYRLAVDLYWITPVPFHITKWEASELGHIGPVVATTEEMFDTLGTKEEHLQGFEEYQRGYPGFQGADAFLIQHWTSSEMNALVFSLRYTEYKVVPPLL